MCFRARPMDREKKNKIINAINRAESLRGMRTTIGHTVRQNVSCIHRAIVVYTACTYIPYIVYTYVTLQLPTAAALRSGPPTRNYKIRFGLDQGYYFTRLYTLQPPTPFSGSGLDGQRTLTA